MSVELIDEKKEDEPLSEMHVVVHEKKAKLVKSEPLVDAVAWARAAKMKAAKKVPKNLVPKNLQTVK